MHHLMPCDMQKLHFRVLNPKINQSIHNVLFTKTKKETDRIPKT